MATDEVKKVKLKVKCRVIEESDLIFDKQDKFCESGSYGKVRRATFEGKHVAVKYFLSPDEKGYKQELAFLVTLQKHENIVDLHGTGISKKQRYIVMEFAPYSLEKVLHGAYPQYCYDAGHVLHWSRQLALGLEYIHNKRILHRDVKASNLLLFGNGSHLKLCDFGTCRNLETNLLYTSNVGTVRYMAPEVIKGEAYTQKCDIFSFAITLWEMLARKIPTVSTSEHLNTYAILFQMAEGKRPPEIVNLPSVITELINKCWHQDPMIRLSSSALVEKLNKLSSFFEFGLPIVEQSLGDDTFGSRNSDGDNDTTSTIKAEKTNNAQPVPESGINRSNRTQSDVSQVKDYVQGKLRTTSDFTRLQQQMSVPEMEEKSFAQDLAHGYPPHKSPLPSSKKSQPPDVGILMKRNSSDCSEVQIDHEVQEVIDPDSDDKRYVSLDENVLRLDVQQQYRKLQQYYQSSKNSSASLPSNINRKLISSTYTEPTKADSTSPYAITGLPPELQPVIPDESDPESLKIYAQYKELSKLYQT